MCPLPVSGCLSKICAVQQLIDRCRDESERCLDLMQEIRMELELVFVALLFLKSELVLHLELIMLPVAPDKCRPDKVDDEDEYYAVENVGGRTPPERWPRRCWSRTRRRCIFPA